MSAISDSQQVNTVNDVGIVLNGYKNKYFGGRLPLKASRKESITLQKREDRTSPDSSISPEAPFRCSFCPSFFAQEQEINEHLQVSHKVLSTTLCPLCKCPVQDLAQHIALEHPQRFAAAVAASDTLQVTSSSVESVNLTTRHQYDRRSTPSPLGRESPDDNIMMRNNRVNAADTDSSPTSPLQSNNLLLRTTTEMLRAASNSNSSSTSSSPVLSLVHGRVSNNNNNNNVDNNSALPMNLSVRNGNKNSNNNNNIFDAGKTVARLLNGSNKLLYEHPNHVLPTSDGDSTSDMSDMSLARKRRKQTHVPDSNKDDRYWARRMKNNEAAKRSRDMRIRREKGVFEENTKLEQQNSELKTNIERLATDNKELHLKMDIILEENTRLKSLLLNYQAREEIQRKRLSSEFENQHHGPQHQQRRGNSDIRRSRGSLEDHTEKPFPFPE